MKFWYITVMPRERRSANPAALAAGARQTLSGARLTFYGGVGEVTGSRHLLEAGGKRVLLDCGLFQGHRRESIDKNRRFPFNPESIDAVLLSHAHIDHSGNL